MPCGVAHRSKARASAGAACDWARVRTKWEDPSRAGWEYEYERERERERVRSWCQLLVYSGRAPDFCFCMGNSKWIQCNVLLQL